MSTLEGTRRARWSAWDVSVGDILEALVHNRRPVAPGHPRTLAGVLNLVGVASDHAESRDMAALIDEMGHHRPSRTVLVHLSSAAQGMNGTVVSDYVPLPGGSELVMELVEVEVPAGHADGLASVVAPLLRRDLPTALWVPHAPATDGPSGSLDPLVDRLITEAGSDPEGPAAGLRRLASRLAAGSPPTTDLAWAALTPWRQLLVHVLDAEALESVRSAGAEVSVFHGGDGPSARALLLAGWLGGFAGPAARVECLPDQGRHEPLTRVAVVGHATGRRLEVAAPAGRPGALVTVTEPGGEVRERMLPLPQADRARLLAGELELGRRDRVFEAALAAAVGGAS